MENQEQDNATVCVNVRARACVTTMPGTRKHSTNGAMIASTVFMWFHSKGSGFSYSKTISRSCQGTVWKREHWFTLAMGLIKWVKLTKGEMIKKQQYLKILHATSYAGKSSWLLQFPTLGVFRITVIIMNASWALIVCLRWVFSWALSHWNLAEPHEIRIW